MGVTIKHHLKAGRPVLTQGHRSTWCEKARLLALVILFKNDMNCTYKKCVDEDEEETSVRFYDFLFYRACSEIQFFFSLPRGNVAQ